MLDAAHIYFLISISWLLDEDHVDTGMSIHITAEIVTKNCDQTSILNKSVTYAIPLEESMNGNKKIYFVGSTQCVLHTTVFCQMMFVYKRPCTDITEKLQGKVFSN